MDTKHFDIDLAEPLPRWAEVPPGFAPRATIWLHGRPLGSIALPHRGNAVYRRGLARAITSVFSDRILRQLVLNGLATPGNASLGLDHLLRLPPSAGPGRGDPITVVVCTRGGRTDRLERCLEGLEASEVPPAEVIVVRYGRERDPELKRPSSASDGKGRVPVRWIFEPEADLARARNLALDSVSTRLVAFIDESVRVDPRWSLMLSRTFRENPQAVAVTGSVLGDTIQDEPSRLLADALDRLAWGKGYDFLWWQPEPGKALPRPWLNVLQLGSAANMAFRTEALRRRFEPHSAAGGAGQPLDLWLRILEEGRAVVREPAASGRDAGVASMAEAEVRIRETAAGITAALVLAAARRPSSVFGIAVLIQWFLRTALVASVRRRGDERSLARACLKGHLAGMWQGIAGLFRRRTTPGTVSPASALIETPVRSPFENGRVRPIELALAAPPSTEGSESPRDAVAEVDLGHPDSMRDLRLARGEPTAEIMALWHGQMLGLVQANTAGRRISPAQVRRLVVERHFGTFLLRHLGLAPIQHEIDGIDRPGREGRSADAARRRLLGHLHPPVSMAGRQGPGRPEADATVSIIVPTSDRPDDLRECLASIFAQETDRPVEVIVVDNRPASGRTAAVVADFPGVRLVVEARRGSAYTRNRGLLACRGSIVVFCDDDVVVPTGWLASMLAPFDDPCVGVVTGNIVPHALETDAQRLNEASCSLGRGSEPFAVDGTWFYGSPGPVQGWEFGTTANAAVRTEVFRDPAVGLFAESLGPGTPVGAGEDPYFFYRVLKSAYRLEYLPDAWVWHKHRTSHRALRRQVYNYAKSAVGYHLMTLLADGDRRARSSLFGGLQRYYLRRLLQAARGRAEVPVRIVLVEIAGNLAGGFSFVASECRRRLLARDPAHPPTPPALPARPAPEWQSEPWALMPASTPSSGDRAIRRGRPGGRLPHFLVIGAQKSGTTALHHNLRKHPSIELVPNFRGQLHDWDNRKETAFFDGGGRVYGLRTLDDYRALFNDNGLVQGEACPSYQQASALDAIAKAIPDVRLILICREPVSRVESAFNHLMQWHAQVPAIKRWATWDATQSFDANLEAELRVPDAFGLVRMGMYADAIERVLARFRPEQLLVLVAEEYRADPQGTYDRIFDFLGVHPARIKHHDVHVREHTTRLTDGQRDRLVDLYRPYNERFFRLIGREVPSWNLGSTAAGLGGSSVA